MNFSRQDENENCTDEFLETNKQTNIGMVLGKMKYGNNVVIKQGYFPEPLEGLEDKLIFDSVDVDLEYSIYGSMRYF